MIVIVERKVAFHQGLLIKSRLPPLTAFLPGLADPAAESAPSLQLLKL